MKKYTYIPTGVCATRIVIYINEMIIQLIE